MDINYFKDCIFDLLNENDDLNLVSIESNDKTGTFLVTTEDGSWFLVTCEKVESV